MNPGMLLVVTSLLFSVLSMCPPQRQARTERQEEVLRERVEAFLRVVETRKPAALLPFFSAKGVAFGIDAERTSLRDAKADLRPGGPLHALFLNLADLLVLEGERRLAVSIEKEKSGALIGNVTLTIHGSAQAELHPLNSLTMDFILESGRWKLMSMEYP